MCLVEMLWMRAGAKFVDFFCKNYCYKIVKMETGCPLIMRNIGGLQVWAIKPKTKIILRMV